MQLKIYVALLKDINSARAFGMLNVIENDYDFYYIS